MKRTPRLPLLILAFFATASARAATPLTLAQAVHYAIEHSPAIVAAADTRALRENDYRNRVSALLPQADLTAVHGLGGTFDSPALPAPTSPRTSNLTGTLSESLYDNGQSLTQLKTADLSRQLAVLDYQRTRDSLVLEVVQGYYRLSAARTVQEANVRQQELLDKQFRQLTDQYKMGLKTRKDFVRFEAQVQKGQTTLLNGQAGMDHALVELRRSLGFGLGPATDTDFVSVSPDRAEAAPPASLSPELPLAATYEARLAQLQKTINEQSVSLAEREYWPRAFVTADLAYQNAGYLGPNGTTTNGGWNWDALLTIKASLWDWGTRRRGVSSAELTRDISAASLDQNLLVVSSLLMKLGKDLDRDRRIHLTNQELLKLETQSFKYVESDYREGKISYLDFETALNNLLAARTGLYASYYGYLQDVAQYSYYEGTAYDRFTTEAKN